MFREPLCPSSGAREYYTVGWCLWYLVLMVPETCWASNKIFRKNHLLHLVGILFPHINDDARSKPHQICNRRCCALFSSLACTQRLQSTQTLVLSWTVVLGLEQPDSGAAYWTPCSVRIKMSVLNCSVSLLGSRHSSVGIVTKLRAGRSEIRIPTGAKGFSLFQKVQTGSGAHPASSSVRTGVLSQG